jgi:hypothetical protein
MPDPRRIRPAHPVIDRRDRQQPTRPVASSASRASRRRVAASKSIRNRTEAIDPLLSNEERKSPFDLQGNPTRVIISGSWHKSSNCASGAPLP